MQLNKFTNIQRMSRENITYLWHSIVIKAGSLKETH